MKNILMIENNIHQIVEQATNTIKICVDRLEMSLKELRSGEIKSFIEMHRLQKIAFTNFKTLDFLATQQKCDLRKFKQITNLVKKIIALEKEITTLLDKTVIEHRKRINKITSSKPGIANYARCYQRYKFTTKS